MKQQIIDILDLLDISSLDLENLINQPEYHTYKIPKKRGGWREIAAPAAHLKLVQKKLNDELQARYQRIKPEEVYGFIRMWRQCNIVSNARPHIGKRFVLNMDLKDFFPCITAKRVKELFSSDMFQFDEQAAIGLTLLTTYQGRLPTGSPTSPVISNFVCFALDRDLANFSKTNQMVYTRYADDLTFSSDHPITEVLVSTIIRLIEKHQFRLNEKKLRLKSAHTQQTVTGIVVNEKVNVNRKLLKKIRAMLHDWRVNGLNQAANHHFGYAISEEQQQTFLNRLKGYINFVGQVRGKDDLLYRHMKSELKSNKLADKNKHKIWKQKN
jgi:RNA-directed DNA polymerase